ILDALDDAAPLEAVPVFHEGQVIAKLPQVEHPKPWIVGARSDVADGWSSALLADGQRSHDLAGHEGERLRQLGCRYRVLELSRPIEGGSHRIEKGRPKGCVGLQGYILPARASLILDISRHLRRGTAVIVELVPGKRIGRRRKLMIHATHEKILPDDVVWRAGKFTDIQ